MHLPGDSARVGRSGVNLSILRVLLPLLLNCGLADGDVPLCSTSTGLALPFKGDECLFGDCTELDADMDLVGEVWSLSVLAGLLLSLTGVLRLLGDSDDLDVGVDLEGDDFDEGADLEGDICCGLASLALLPLLEGSADLLGDPDGVCDWEVLGLLFWFLELLF